MFENFKACLNIFFILGLSVKSFDRKLKLCEKFYSVWSFSLVFVAVIGAALIGWLAQPLSRDGVKLFVLLTFEIFILNTFVLLSSSILFRKAEQAVWKLFDQLEIIFVTEFKLNLRKEQFARQCWQKIIFEYLVFIVFSFPAFKPVDNARGPWTFLVLTTIIRSFLIKFVFYVDILNFCLRNIETKLKKGENSVNELMRLKRAFSLCWRMGNAINDLFGWGLLTTSPLIVCGALYSVHSLCINLVSNNRFNINPTFVVTSISIQVFLLAMSSHKSTRFSTVIASLVLRQSSKEKHRIIESFALQLIHQKIIVTGKTVFQVNNGAMISVS